MNKYISSSIEETIKSDIIYSNNALYFIDKKYNICKYDVINKKNNIIYKIDINSVLILGNLSIDNNKLCLLVLLHNNYFLYIIDLNNNIKIYSDYIYINLQNINIIKNNEIVLGINKNSLISYNLINKQTTNLYNGFTQVVINSNILKDNYYYFTSNCKLKKYDTKENILCNLNSIYIYVDTYKYKLLKENDYIVINEIQKCICIIGRYKNNIFVAHLSENCTIISELISFIKIQLPCYEQMDFKIIGNIYNEKYRNIKKFLGSKYKFNLLNHLDKKYNVIISNENIIIN